MDRTNQQIAKEAAAEAAAALIEDNMLVGLGTGSTSSLFIACLGARCKNGLKIKAIASSNHSSSLARAEGIALIDADDCVSVDITVDGADEVDPQKRMIKGGGGALFKEKIIASISRRLIIIVDETKLAPQLGRAPLPVEISPFVYRATLKKIEALGHSCKMRIGTDGDYFKTEHGNFIADLSLSYPCKNIAEEDLKLHAIPGVIETGFFAGFADRIIVGYPDRHIKIFD